MNIEGLNLSNMFTGVKLDPTLFSKQEAENSFAAILRNSLSEESTATDKIGQLASEGEDKYCSMCGSRIKEDGTCPICIVPIFMSGNPGSHSQSTSQTSHTSSISGAKAILSYHRRKR